MKCTLEQKNRIINAIIDQLLSDNPTKKSIETNIKKSGESDFTFSGFLSNLTDDELQNLILTINDLGYNASDYFSSNKIIITENRNNVSAKLSATNDINEIFHNQNNLRLKFTT